MADNLQQVTQTVVTKALQGDVLACKVILDRLMPIRRGTIVNFQLPEATTVTQIDNALSMLRVSERDDLPAKKARP
jgi:hypothetical protein